MKAYHGSPYKFSKFTNKNAGESGQIGAELGFWFTTSKIVAANFAMLFPREYYNKKGQIENDFSTQNVVSKWFNSHPQKAKVVAKLLEICKNNDEYWREGLDVYEHILLQIGKNNLIKELGEYGIGLREKIDISEQKMESSFTELRNTYTNMKGNLYELEIEMGKTKTLKGEVIGVGQGRADAILSAQQKKYDSVIIKNADTGQGIADEIVVFDANRIKILNTTEV